MSKLSAIRPCATKVAWATQALAEGHKLVILANGKAKDPSRLHTYRCPHCELWHVGHDNFARVES